MEMRRIRAVTALVIFGGAAIATAAYFLWTHHQREARSRRLWMTEIEVGDTAARVRNLLGEPDLAIPSSEAKFAGRCANALGATTWRYLAGSSGGPYLDIYFDRAGRVTCIEKGFVAI